MSQSITFCFISLFPEMLKGYFQSSILSRAVSRGLVSLEFENPRDFSTDPYKKVDDYQIGGGAGLLLGVQAVGDCLESVYKRVRTHTVFLTPVGKLFQQSDSKRLSKSRHITLVCGRYEGFDERLVEKYADEVFSIGDFILTGGELPALALCDSISRHINGVLGNTQSLEGESFENGLLESPNFAKPYVYSDLSTISAYSKGNHGRILDFRQSMARAKTQFYRPQLYTESTRKITKKGKYEK